MLSREHRYSFDRGVPENALSTPYFTLRYRAKKDSFLKCAVVVGKKVSKKSPVRNRLKRIFSESLQDALPGLDAPYDLVFYLRAPVLSLTRDEIALLIRDVLKRGNILQ